MRLLTTLLAGAAALSTKQCHNIAALVNSGALSKDAEKDFERLAEWVEDVVEKLNPGRDAPVSVETMCDMLTLSKQMRNPLEQKLFSKAAWKISLWEKDASFKTAFEKTTEPERRELKIVERQLYQLVQSVQRHLGRPQLPKKELHGWDLVKVAEKMAFKDEQTPAEFRKMLEHALTRGRTVLERSAERNGFTLLYEEERHDDTPSVRPEVMPYPMPVEPEMDFPQPVIHDGEFADGREPMDMPMPVEGPGFETGGFAPPMGRPFPPPPHAWHHEDEHEWHHSWVNDHEHEHPWRHDRDEHHKPCFFSRLMHGLFGHHGHHHEHPDPHDTWIPVMEMAPVQVSEDYREEMEEREFDREHPWRHHHHHWHHHEPRTRYYSVQSGEELVPMHVIHQKMHHFIGLVVILALFGTIQTVRLCCVRRKLRKLRNRPEGEVLHVIDTDNVRPVAARTANGAYEEV